MDAIVQWATILSPIIAVMIAVWTSRNSAKDTDRKLAQMRESTEQEIKSIKQLAKLQIEASIIELDKELSKSSTLVEQANEEAIERRKCEEDRIQVFKELALKEFEARQSERNYKYARMYLEKLNTLRKRFDELQKQINM